MPKYPQSVTPQSSHTYHFNSKQTLGKIPISSSKKVACIRIQDSGVSIVETQMVSLSYSRGLQADCKGKFPLFAASPLQKTAKQI